jgi:hypothetical protein
MDMETPQIEPVEFPYRMADRIGPMRFSEMLPNGKALYVYDPEPETPISPSQSPELRTESPHTRATEETRHVKTSGGLQIKNVVNTRGKDFVGRDQLGQAGEENVSSAATSISEVRRKGFLGRGVVIDGHSYKSVGFDEQTGETILVPED